jgi:hypothetical protein
MFHRATAGENASCTFIVPEAAIFETTAVKRFWSVAFTFDVSVTVPCEVAEKVQLNTTTPLPGIMAGAGADTSVSPPPPDWPGISGSAFNAFAPPVFETTILTATICPVDNTPGSG